jgi:hypothetical protein
MTDLEELPGKGGKGRDGKGERGKGLLRSSGLGEGG